jgi:imidazolonepropionase-like amidohydrolase
MLKPTKKLLFLLLTLPCLLFGQDPKIEVTKTYVLQNVLLVAKPGAAPTKTSILFKDGVITQIGVTKPPFDAKIINADSLYAYSAFIDPMSFTGIKKDEEKKDAPKPASRGAANMEQSGITPQITALSKYSIKESNIADMRKAGFAISQVFPKGRMLAGSSAIVSLKEAEHEDKVLLNQNQGILASFTTSNGVAPGTLIGVIAKYRDVFRNTENAIKNMATYNATPSGLTRPTFSEELAAMMPVVKKELPLYFSASNSKDIHRAINLQKDYGFKMILTDVKQSNHALPLIKAGGYPVLLSLDLPEEEKAEHKKEDKKDDTKKPEDKKDDVAKKEDKKEEVKKEEPKKELTAEQKAFNERKKAAYETTLKQAGELEKNAIPFSFSYADTKIGDIHKSIKQYIKFGLSESAALAALTTTPANMLGLSKVAGTIEQGKMANIVLSSKPIFDEKSEIKYVIIEGNVSDYNEKKKASEGKVDPKGAKIEGEWSYSVETPGGKQGGKINFQKDGDGYKGTSTSDADPSQKSDLKNISVEGNKVKFDMDFNMGQPITLNFDLEMNADNFTGTVAVGPMGTFPITGSKISGPKN